ncbi:MAG: glucose-6-phosphate isomerase [Phycisphaerales bacterium]
MLTIDHRSCLSSRVGDHGLAPEVFKPDSAQAKTIAKLTEKLESTRDTGWEKWRGLPFSPARDAYVASVKAAVEKRRGKFENMVVLGIGGSALGNIALQSALNPATYNLLPAATRGGPRVFVVDNVDPAYLGSVLEFCKQSEGGIAKTLFNVVSKSGETAETAAQFMTIRQLLIDELGEAKHAENIVAITDAEKGTMRTICNENGYETMPVPEGVGGRFSVLSPVGLFSAAMAGIDIDALLDGAADMDRLCSSKHLIDNPAATLAVILHGLGETRGKVNHVMMPYCNQLYLMADWFRQLWAESLGKHHDLQGKEVFAGYTPIKALGTTDQHSQVQLYREGPNDKVFLFLEVDDFGTDLTIPDAKLADPLSYLQGQSFTKLLNAEKRATEFAFIESKRPSVTINFPQVDAYHVGQFIYLFEMVTAYCGLMLNVDAYDQPAVETGKVATFGLMGREGYGEWKQKVEKALGE